MKNRHQQTQYPWTWKTVHPSQVAPFSFHVIRESVVIALFGSFRFPETWKSVPPLEDQERKRPGDFGIFILSQVEDGLILCK